MKKTLLVTFSAERADALNEAGLEFDLAAFIRFDPLIRGEEFDTIIFDENEATSDNLKKEISPLLASCDTFVRLYEKDGHWTTVATSHKGIPNVK